MQEGLLYIVGVGTWVLIGGSMVVNLARKTLLSDDKKDDEKQHITPVEFYKAITVKGKEKLVVFYKDMSRLKDRQTIHMINIIDRVNGEYEPPSKKHEDHASKIKG